MKATSSKVRPKNTTEKNTIESKAIESNTIEVSPFSKVHVVKISRDSQNVVIEEFCQTCETGNLNSLKDIHKEDSLAWAQEYMKLNFQQPLFTDERRTNMDKPEWWSKIVGPN